MMRNTRRFPPNARGRSLLELMAALIIGMIILGGVLLTSVSTSGTQQTQNSTAYLAEEAQIATNLLTWHLRSAGYSQIVAPPRPTLTGEDSQPFRHYEGPAVRGCDGGTDDTSANMAVMACRGGTGADSLTVAYEANTWSTMPVNSNGQVVPSDCIGNGITTLTPSEAIPGQQFRLAENTFFVVNGSLSCKGSGGNANTTAQPLVANVRDMQVTYGVAATPVLVAGSTTPVQPLFEPVRYLTAAQVDALPLFPADAAPAIRGRWNQVVSVRICLTLRSPEPVHSKATPYAGCDGESITPGDSHAYRTVAVSTALKNRTAPCADQDAAPGAAKPAADRCVY